MLNVHTVYMTLSSHSEWISNVSALISLRLQLNFIIANKRDVEHFIPGERQQCFWLRGGGWLWVRMCRNCVHMGCVLCSLSLRLLCHFFPIILSFNPFHPSLVPLFFHVILSTLLPSSTFVFPHLFAVLSSFPTRPSLACLLFSPRRLSICLDKMDGLQKLNDTSNGKNKKVEETVWCFSTIAEQKQTTLWKTCQQHSPYLHSVLTSTDNLAAFWRAAFIVRPRSFRVSMKQQSQPILHIG